MDNTFRTPLIALGVIVGVVTLLSVITKSQGFIEFDDTERALSNLLQSSESSFTHAVDLGLFVRTTRETATWLDGAEDDPFLGNQEASIVIVEFSDFQCPFCKAAFPHIREFIESQKGAVKYIYRDFPVESIHPDARIAAEAGACAHEQGHFWSFHDRIFQNQSNIGRQALIQYALQSGINTDTFIKCIDDQIYQDEVEQDLQAGINSGVRGTPTWFVNGEKLEGVLPVDVWDRILTILKNQEGV